MKVREIIKKLENDGWYFKRQKGSHMIFNHFDKKGTVIVPNHGQNKDLKIGTAENILKQAELK